MVQHCLLLAGLACFFFFTQDLLSRGGVQHSGLGPPSLIMNEESAPIDLPTYNLMKVFSQLRFFFLSNSITDTTTTRTLFIL